MFDRVRAIPITALGRIVLMKRIRREVEPYWIAPGGGVEPTDRDAEEALLRELREELGAEADILKLVCLLEQVDSGRPTTTAIYLCRLRDIDESKRSGPEFNDPSRGAYIPEEIQLDRESLTSLNILPPDFKGFICENAQRLFALPDLRQDQPAPP